MLSKFGNAEVPRSNKPLKFEIERLLSEYLHKIGCRLPIKQAKFLKSYESRSSIFQIGHLQVFYWDLFDEVGRVLVGKFVA